MASVVLVGAVAWPGVRSVLGGGDGDGFPLSTYPMFSRDPGRTVEVPSVVVIDADGEVHRLSPAQIARTDQVIQAGVTVRQAIDAGPSAVAALCADVAAGLDDDRWDDGDDRDDDGDDQDGDDEDDDRVARVAVVLERHDSHAWARGEHEPRERRTVGDCPVPP